MDAVDYWACRDGKAIQDDEREFESLLAQEENESRRAREKERRLVVFQILVMLHKKH